MAAIDLKIEVDVRSFFREMRRASVMLDAEPAGAFRPMEIEAKPYAMPAEIPSSGSLIVEGLGGMRFLPTEAI